MNQNLLLLEGGSFIIFILERNAFNVQSTKKNYFKFLNTFNMEFIKKIVFFLIV